MIARAAAAEETEQNILDAARRLFGELAYDQVSLQAVAARAGISVQTVIRRFRSKEQLFAAVSAQISAMHKPVRDEVRAGDIAGAIRVLVDTYEIIGDERLHFMTQEARAEPIRVVVDAGRQFHHSWVERVFGDSLSGLPPDGRKQRLAQLTAVLDLYAWKVLRRDLGLTREEVQRAVEDLVTRLVQA